MKNYKITILPHFKRPVDGLTLLPIKEVITANSFMEAVAKALGIVGVLNDKWSELEHEIVSVRQKKN